MLSKYPRQIKYIVGNEAAERFSFYGMKSILLVFMTQKLLIEKSIAVSYYHTFSAAVYLLPLLGAYISDRFLGKYKTILYLSIIYCLGHLVLAVNESAMGLVWGLALISFGAGGIKPCVSAHVGDQFKPEQKAEMSEVFNLFYWLINFGAFFATLLTPWVNSKYGSKVAFGIPGILMLLATFIFWLGRKHYIHVPPSGKNPNSFLRVIFSGLKNKVGSFKENALHDHPRETVDGVIGILKLLIIYVWISIFWALYDQSGSTWILQAQKMDLNFLGIKWDESQIQAVNPILVMTLIPIFSQVIYPGLEKLGLKLSELTKMSIGLLFATLSYCVVAFSQSMIESGVTVNISWQILSYLFLTIGEVMVSVTGLEFAYTQSPKNMKSTIMSFWLLTVFIGNLFAAQLAHLDFVETASTKYFAFYALFMFLVTLIFMLFSRGYKVKYYSGSNT